MRSVSFITVHDLTFFAGLVTVFLLPLYFFAIEELGSLEVL